MILCAEYLKRDVFCRKQGSVEVTIENEEGNCSRTSWSASMRGPWKKKLEEMV